MADQGRDDRAGRRRPWRRGAAGRGLLAGWWLTAAAAVVAASGSVLAATPYEDDAAPPGGRTLDRLRVVLDLSVNATHWGIADTNGRPEIGGTVEWYPRSRWVLGATARRSQTADRPNRRGSETLYLASAQDLGSLAVDLSLAARRFSQKRNEFNWNFLEARARFSRPLRPLGEQFPNLAAGRLAWHVAWADGLYGRRDAATEVGLAFLQPLRARTAVQLTAARVFSGGDSFDHYSYAAVNVVAPIGPVLGDLGCTYHHNGKKRVLRNTLTRSRCSVRLTYWLW